MGTLALTNAYCYAGSHDFTGDTNQLDLSVDAATVDVTTFRSGGWNESKIGLKKSALKVSGFWQAGSDTVDPESFTNLGTSLATTVGPVETAGQTAYLIQQMPLQYELLGKYGDATPFTLSGQGSDGVGVVRGQLAKAMGTVSATGALGSGVQLGAVGASQYLYATFHVFGTPGTTITVLVESDDNAGFSSATTRMTLGPYTTAGGRWATRVAGAITDDYFRFRVSAITGTFTVAGAIGKQ